MNMMTMNCHEIWVGVRSINYNTEHCRPTHRTSVNKHCGHKQQNAETFYNLKSNNTNKACASLVQTTSHPTRLNILFSSTTTANKMKTLRQIKRETMKVAVLWQM
jgi:hypothetical protein